MIRESVSQSVSSDSDSTVSVGGDCDDVMLCWGVERASERERSCFSGSCAPSLNQIILVDTENVWTLGAT